MQIKNFIQNAVAQLIVIVLLFLSMFVFNIGFDLMKFCLVIVFIIYLFIYFRLYMSKKIESEHFGVSFFFSWITLVFILFLELSFFFLKKDSISTPGLGPLIVPMFLAILIAIFFLISIVLLIIKFKRNTPFKKLVRWIILLFLFILIYFIFGISLELLAITYLIILVVDVIIYFFQKIKG